MEVMSQSLKSYAGNIVKAQIPKLKPKEDMVFLFDIGAHNWVFALSDIFQY